MCWLRNSLTLLLFALLSGAPATAQSIGSPPSVAGVQRPKVALVLSGGGARGAAHLGVLKVLEELRVPVDLIVGTSAGAIVGAAYASGMSVDEIEAEMQSMSTATLFRDQDRVDAPMRRKDDTGVNFIGPEVGVGSQGLALPKGVIAGVALEASLRRLTARQHDRLFDKLPIPFRAIATDVATSEMVVLSQGSLADAIRASMAIPAVVTPIEIDGRLLVDGGIARNLPVDVARNLGADVIIAVNIASPLLRREEIVSVLSVSTQMVRVLTARNLAQSLSELRPTDVLITPILTSVGAADFDHLPGVEAAGEVAARLAIEQLRRHAVTPDVFVAYAAARRDSSTAAVTTRIDEITVRGTKRVNEAVVRAAMRTRVGDPLDTTVVDQDLRRIYGLGDFERVSYDLAPSPGGGQVLTTDVTEKSWGPHFLRLGLSLSTDFAGNAFFNARLNHRSTWLNRLGGEWRNDIQIGRNERLSSEWFQPLSAAQRWFVAAHARAEREPFDVFVERTAVARFHRQFAAAGADVGVPLGDVGELRLGWMRGEAKLTNQVSVLPGALLPKEEIGALALQLRVDTLDSANFPRHGIAGHLRLTDSRPSLGATTAYRKLSVGLRGAYSVDRHTLRGALSATEAIGSGELPVHELSSLGGFLQLSGYRTGQFLGGGSRFARAVYTYRVLGPGWTEGMFVGLSAEAGRIGDVVRGAQASATLHGHSLYVGWDTPIGPLYLAYGRANTANQAVYLFLGQP